MPLHLLLVAFLEAVSPHASRMADAPRIIQAIETVVQDEKEPVLGSKEADAVILLDTAWNEGRMNLHAVGDHGRAFGTFQLHSPLGRGDALVQTRAALGHFRRDRAVCPGLPVAAFTSGNCYHGRALAHYRMRQIMRALEALKHARVLPGRRLAALPKE